MGAGLMNDLVNATLDNKKLKRITKKKLVVHNDERWLWIQEHLRGLQLLMQPIHTINQSERWVWGPRNAP